jgi:hypothetical protein
MRPMERENTFSHEQPVTNWPIGRCTARKTPWVRGGARRY